jgi:arylsulfatase A-like enzyme
MSMVTSTYPDVHGVKPDQRTLPESLPTLGQILEGEGYHGIGLVTSEWLKPDFGFDRGFVEYELLPHRLTYAARVNEAALRRMAGNAGPLFVFLHYYDLHSDFDHGPARNKFPYYATPRDRRHLAVSDDGREFCDAEGRCNTQYLMAADRERRELPQEKIELIHGLYRAAMPRLDAEMGELFERLKATGRYDRSLIIVTSDHGEEFREHGRFIHSQPYDETTGVPLFVKLPGSEHAGSRVPSVVETIDIMPTVLEYLGLPVPPTAQGESLLPLLAPAGELAKNAVLSQDTINMNRYGLRTDDLKLILDLSSGRRELYDLHADPKELVNLEASRIETADRLEARLRDLVQSNRELHDRYGATGWDDPDVLSDEERERLKALGYVD